MLKVIIKNKNNPLTEKNWNYTVNSEDEIVYNDTWGKPERWVRAKTLIPSIDNPEIYIDYYQDEVYTPEDVIEIENRNDFGETIEYVKLKADYTIEIEDITEKLAKETRIKEIKSLLLDLDLKAIRPLLENESVRIEEIKAEKLTLRNELATLTN